MSLISVGSGKSIFTSSCPGGTLSAAGRSLLGFGAVVPEGADGAGGGGGGGGVSAVEPVGGVAVEGVPPEGGVADGMVAEPVGGVAGGGVVPLSIPPFDGAAPPVPFVEGVEPGIPVSPGVVVGGVRGFASVGIGGGSERVCATPVVTPTRSAMTALITYLFRNTLRLPSLDVSSANSTQRAHIQNQKSTSPTCNAFMFYFISIVDVDGSDPFFKNSTRISR